MAALCTEKPEVFHATHDFALRLAADGDVDGLRIDHVDGLYAPEKYLWRLQWSFLAQLARREIDRAGGAEAAESQLVGKPESATSDGEPAEPPMSPAAVLRRVCTLLGLPVARRFRLVRAVRRRE